MSEATIRHAKLRIDGPVERSTLTAAVPGGVTENELAEVARAAFGLVSSIHHCNCLSGVIRFVVEEDFAQAVQVDLGAGAD
jgi:hypothetical protein